MSDAFKPLLAKLADGKTLSEEDAGPFFAACLKGEPTPAQLAAALTALRMRGETVEEIKAGAIALRAASLRFDQPYDVVDTCGTGGDGRHTLNISTAAALVAAGGGIKVAKHGNRALSSSSGSSEVLAALGVNIDAGLAQSRRALDEAGICFLFAPTHNPAMQHVSPVRRDLGFKTIFNLLGPLTNPAGARRQVMGVFDPRWLEPLAQVLGELGAVHAWVVHGQGLDVGLAEGGHALVDLHALVGGNALEDVAHAGAGTGWLVISTSLSSAARAWPSFTEAAAILAPSFRSAAFPATRNTVAAVRITTSW